MKELDKLKVSLDTASRILGKSEGGFEVPLFQYDWVLTELVQGNIELFQGKAGFSSIVKLDDKSRPNDKPFAVVARPDVLPLVLSMETGQNTSDNVFRVHVQVVSPAEANKVNETLEETHAPHLAYNSHYLLNEIANRAAIALCHESAFHDNENARILCCVEDDMTYPTDIDIDAYPTSSKPFIVTGVNYQTESKYEAGSEEALNEFLYSARYDAVYFTPSKSEEADDLSQLDEFFEDNFTETKPTITKVETYLDTRSPVNFGKSDYWVEMIRCSACNQRVILGLTKAQCPEGQPDVSFACKACKTTIKHL